MGRHNVPKQVAIRDICHFEFLENTGNLRIEIESFRAYGKSDEAIENNRWGEDTFIKFLIDAQTACGATALQGSTSGH